MEKSIGTPPLEIDASGQLAWAMLEASPDALVMVDAEGLIQHVNRQTELMFGYDRTQLLGQPVEALLPSHLKSRHEAHRVRFSETPDVRSMGSGMQLSARRCDGTEFPVEISLSPLPTASGMRTLAAVRDITDRVRAEAREREAAALFRSAFGDGPVAMTLAEVSSTSDRVIVDANQAMADLLGFEIADLIGKSFVELTHPDDLDSDTLATKNQLTGDSETFTGRKRYLSADGSVVWVQLFVSVLSQQDDRIVTIGHSVDITAEVAAEVARKRQSQSLEALGEIRSALMSSAISMSETLDLVCQCARDIASADRVAYCRLDRRGDHVQQVAVLGESKNLSDAREIVIDSQLERALDGGSSVENDLPTGPRMVVPVEEGQRVEGVLVIERHHGRGPFNDDDLLLISNFATSAGAALQVNEARAGRQRAELLEDRERIGRDMHDKVIGRLFATGMALQSTTARISDTSSQERILSAVGELDDVIREIRTTIYGLRSQLDWGKGARGEILAVAADHRSVLGFEPRVDLAGPVDLVPRNVVDQALATLREALTNAAKHANASNVTITVDVTNTDFSMTIRDDGVGLDVGTYPVNIDNHGNGLRNMASRAERLGGTNSLTSPPGEGVCVEWTVPFH